MLGSIFSFHIYVEKIIYDVTYEILCFPFVCYSLRSKLLRRFGIFNTVAFTMYLDISKCIAKATYKTFYNLEWRLMDKSHMWSLWGCTAHMVLVAVFLLLGQHLRLEDSRTAS